MSENKTKILILGANGLAGNAIVKVLLSDPSLQLGVSVRGSADEFIGKGISVHKFDALKDSPYFAKDYDYIINCIGAIPQGGHEYEEMIRLNAVFPHELARNCPNSKIFHLTTDCVFDYCMCPTGARDEITGDYCRDTYGKSKYLGEVNAFNVLNLRCSIIGPELGQGYSFFNNFINSETVTGFTNYLWNGVTTYHLAQVIKGIIKNNLFEGNTHHLIPSGQVTKWQMMSILDEFHWNGEKLKKNIVKKDSPLAKDRTLTTVNGVKNRLYWFAAGYSSPPNFTTMICELNRFYHQYYGNTK